VSYTCIEQSGYAGSNGNISSDPGFTDPVNGDFRLTSGSPCIDAGNGDYAPPIDISGNPREDDPATANTGSGNPDYTDMGAFEYLFTTGYIQYEEDDVVRIFPNPASGTFHMTVTHVCDVEIIDITGKLIRRFKLNPEELISVTVTSGTYFIRTKTTIKTIVRKIIIL